MPASASKRRATYRIGVLPKALLGIYAPGCSRTAPRLPAPMAPTG